MSDFAIRTEGLGKKYRLRHHQEQARYVALRDVLADGVRRAASTLLPARRTTSKRAEIGAAASRGRTEDFWALSGVTFDVKHGEVVGIIGRNGAGKSTLLKILSRITEPTVGRARLRGRVASLLEVGTGFHPELTGRENIYLNGAILGMTKAEIRRKFDEIVAFAEVEQFLDTPVKRYSSGMYVRLAFAVAAHLEPEILIVDEVLAVGDMAFQMKCLGKMKDVSADGRTILYVSHNLSSVTNLCRRGILLSRGTVTHDTTAERAVAAYMQAAHENRTGDPHVVYVNPDPRVDVYTLTRVELLDVDDQPKATIRPMDAVKIRVWFHVPARLPQGSVVIELASVHGTTILKLESNPRKFQPLAFGQGLYYADCIISSLPLMEGRYIVGVGLAVYGVRWLTWIPDAGTLLVSEPMLGAGSDMSVDRKGLLVVEHQWEAGKCVAC
jgi:lipopolysaccharide transport system ATP-binding protein